MKYFLRTRGKKSRRPFYFSRRKVSGKKFPKSKKTLQFLVNFVFPARASRLPSDTFLCTDYGLADAMGSISAHGVSPVYLSGAPADPAMIPAFSGPRFSGADLQNVRDFADSPFFDTYHAHHSKEKLQARLARVFPPRGRKLRNGPAPAEAVLKTSATHFSHFREVGAESV